MKKNWMLRLGLLAMVLTLVTMPMVSSTYAKYVTEESGTAYARVAKWGVEITAPTSADVFAKTYKDPTSTDITVESTAYVVAPGTDGAFAGVTITGTPEVAVNVKLDAELTLAGWTVERGTTGFKYCPIVITVGGDDFAGYDYDDLADFEAAVEVAISALTEDYPVGTNLANVTADFQEFSWAWAFETSDGDGGYYDVEDTALGELAFAGSAPTIALEITVTVTQID